MPTLAVGVSGSRPHSRSAVSISTLPEDAAQWRALSPNRFCTQESRHVSGRKRQTAPRCTHADSERVCFVLKKNNDRLHMTSSTRDPKWRFSITILFTAQKRNIRHAAVHQR